MASQQGQGASAVGRASRSGVKRLAASLTALALVGGALGLRAELTSHEVSPCAAFAGHFEHDTFVANYQHSDGTWEDC